MLYNTCYLNVRIFFLLIALISAIPALTQNKVTPAQALQFYNEAKVKGMSDAEIEKLALESGYTQADLLQLQQQLASDAAAEEVVDEHIRESIPIRGIANEVPAASAPEPSNPTDSQIFGQVFFSQGGVSFEPNLQIPTPLNYVVGPGDEILVDVSGNAVNNYKLTVSPEGTVNLANFPPLFVSGLTMDEAQKKIISKLKTAYAGPGIYTNVSLGKIRSIRITVTGEVKKPGTYTISSLATAFHALYVSGGPSLKGTMRQIEIIRNNKSVRKIDFYKFLVKGDVSDNIMLADQDIIFVRPAESLVSIQGEVKRPGVFEILKGEDLSTAISFAGGFNSEAYSHSISYQRNTGKEYELGQVSNSNYVGFQLKDGDKFSVGKILNRFINRVTIRGAVFREGEYPISEQLQTVTQLIKAADGITENAFLNRALLYRQNGLLEPIVIPIDLKKLLSNNSEDITLKRDDILEIKSVQDLKEQSGVSIFGEVRKQGEYLFREGMTVGDLIFEAGGYTSGGIPFRVEVSRRIKADTLNLPLTQNVRIFQLNVADSLQLTEEDRRFGLKPFDHVFIRKSPRYESQKIFTVLGQVNYPGNYTVIRSVERISDAIERAGGLKEAAYLNAAQFRRRGTPIALDLNSILKNPDQPANLLLQMGDSLLIPERHETVEIVGGVLNPSVVNYDRSHNLKDYLVQAGGFVDSANKRKLLVTHPNGITDRTRQFLFFRSYPKVEPGSRIVVPLKDSDPNRQQWSRGERVMLISSIATVSVTLIRVLQEIWTK